MATLAVFRDSFSVLRQEGTWYPKGGQSVGGMGSSPCSTWEEKANRAWELSHEESSSSAGHQVSNPLFSSSLEPARP